MKKLYKENCEVIVSIEEMIFCYKRQNYNKGNLLEADILDKISGIINELIKLDFITEDNLTGLLEPLLQAKQNEDYILLADLYELQIIPFLTDIQNSIRTEQSPEEIYWNKNLNILEASDKQLAALLYHKKEKESGLQYQIEDTNIGAKTLKVLSDEREWYLHSNGNPYMEGLLFAEEYYDAEKSDYIILGLGLGYHVKELWKKNKNVTITIFETDLEVLRLALRYQDFTDILDMGKIKFMYDPALNALGEVLKNFQGAFLIYYPVLGYINNKEQREVFEEYFLQLSSIKNRGYKLKENFKKNKNSFEHFADELRKKWFQKEIIIAAGGPSLDQDLESIKRLQKERILIAVGTVFRKLLKKGIQPDYVIITDSQEFMKNQVEGVENMDIPLLFLSTVSPGVLKAYKGKKYCILQYGFEEAEEYARQNGLQLYQTGGSVATTAIELAIRLGDKTIYCFGLDLAYTGNKTHAEGTLGYRTINDYKLRKVKSVDGGFVYTTKNLDSYRHWIERRIVNEKMLDFWNISRGAYINGMKNKLSI